MRASIWFPFCCLALACGSHRASRSAGPPIKSALQDDACFGGTPDVLTTQVGVGSIDLANGNGTPLFVSGGNLLWQVREGPTMVNLATRERERVHLGYHAFFKTADDREAYNVSFDMREPREWDMDLVAVDLKTGKARTVVAGKDQHMGVSPDTHVVLDGEYVYFIRPRPYGTPTARNGFFRARRDGTGTPERIGAEPEGMRTPFLIEDGYVYWNRDNGTGGPALWRRALAPESPIQRLASTKDHHLPLFIDQRRLFYADDSGVFSLPLDGSAPPTLHASNPGAGRSSVVADQACVYWTNERGIFRTRLGQSGAPELIANEDSYRGGTIVTDGKRLYWVDHRRDRILSLGRAAASLAERPFLLARTIDAKALPADSAGPDSMVMVGDGWGCAKVFGWNQPHWQCWTSGAQAGAPVKAKSVPGLSPTADPAVGPDRLCLLDGSKGKCWSWTELVRGKPADFLEAQVHKGRLGEWLVGATFSCLHQYIGAERMLVCSGDNAFGQLADKDQPVALERRQVALGAWHGCVSGTSEAHDLDCWGRGDAGQLGRVPDGTCTVGGKPIPCDSNLRKADFAIPGLHNLQAGDMFTCATFGYPQELRCWGASRDGWFGDTPCSSELRQAWPVGTGFVAAPKAMCSTVPTRVVEPGSELRDISVGPRGVCLMEDGKARCLGAIATPSAPVGKIAVSKGAQANACGTDGSRVLCWGEGYSPAQQPGLVVPIAFESTVPASAVVDFPPPAGSKWSEDHLINHGCHRVPIALPTCAAQATGEAWSTLASKADSLQKQRVSVRDRLVVGPFADSSFVNTVCTGQTHNPRAHSWHDGSGGHLPPGTTPLGCYRDQRRIVLGTGVSPLRIWDVSGNFDCVGDESRLCCGAPALGQTVIATGVLTGSASNGWGLKDATLCEAAPR